MCRAPPEFRSPVGRPSVRYDLAHGGATIHTLGVIPARFASTRFPGKLVADLGGLPVIVRVLDRARSAGLDQVVVAADDPRIADAVTRAGGEVVMPPGTFQSGTDRIAAALDLLSPPPAAGDIVVNIQGDEPFLEPALIAETALTLAADPAADMATLATPATEAERDDPNAVKVVLAADGRALYFSRAPIPARRGGGTGEKEPSTLRHVGLYAFRAGFLRRFVSWPPGRLERLESLEQLRALERGALIKVIVRNTQSFGIDTPADLERARRLLKEQIIR